MEQYISKSALVAEIERLKDELKASDSAAYVEAYIIGAEHTIKTISDVIDTLEVKEVDLIIHTIIAECCDWLAMNTNLSHDKIEGCRNLMLTVKEEQLKAQKGG